MKVIKHGKAAGTLKSECQDPSCECQVELSPNDCRSVPDDRDGAAIVWTCPDCKRDNWVATSTVPGAFARAVR